jgi:hypothetical protein
MTVTETEFTTDGTPEGAGESVAETVSEQVEAIESAETTDSGEVLFEVDGKPITVDEARNGYLRQADYTRKTQELAEQRKSLRNAEVLQAALQRDPQATLKALADAYGVGFANQVASTADEDGGWGDVGDTEQVDPRLEELVQWRQQQEVAAAQAHIQKELTDLESVYGEFDHSEVLRFALDRGFPDVTSAFKAWRFDDVQTELSRRTEEQKRVQAKRDAQVVEASAGRAGATSAGTPQGGMSIRDAWLAAKKEHGG